MIATQLPLFQQIASLLGPLTNPEKIKTLFQGAQKGKKIGSSAKRVD